MHEELIAFIRDNPDGVDSTRIATQVLKFKNPDQRIANLAVKSILAGDSRCCLGEDGIWRAVAAATTGDDVSLADVPWVAVLALVDPTGNHPDSPIHVSAWSVGDDPRPLMSRWLADPSQLPSDEQEVLRSPLDAPFQSDTELVVGEIARALDDRALIVLSGRQLRILSLKCAASGESLTDDATLVGQLMRAADVPRPRSVDPLDCHRAVLGTAPVVSSAASHGRCLARAAGELLRRLPDKGIRTRSDLERANDATTPDVDWSNKSFTPEDIAALPLSAGVYGFKNALGAYVYIGKAKSLRRRIGGYFRETDESPEKLEALRRDAHELTVHHCGSELESLVLEYRLIRKHNPALNTMTAINERKGQYKPIDDCIVLLPHADREKVMTFWFRREQKVLLRPALRDMGDLTGLSAELASFFFSHSTPVSARDFPEQEIVFRWLKRRLDHLTVIPVSRMGSADQILDAWRGAIGEVPGGVTRGN